MKNLLVSVKDGQQTYLYTITDGRLTAEISHHGATLVKLFVAVSAWKPNIFRMP